MARTGTGSAHHPVRGRGLSGGGHAFTAAGLEDLLRYERGLVPAAADRLRQVCAALVWPPRPAPDTAGLIPGSECGWHRPGDGELRECVVVYREATREDRRVVGADTCVVVVRILTNSQLALICTDRAMVAVIDAMEGVTSGAVRRLWQGVLLRRWR